LLLGGVGCSQKQQCAVADDCEHGQECVLGKCSVQGPGEIDGGGIDGGSEIDGGGIDGGGEIDGGGDDIAVYQGLPARNLSIVVNRDIDVAPTPILNAYPEEVDATQTGEQIISYQKYFRNEALIVAMLNAARRGVQVRGYYGDNVDPSCDSLLEPDDTIDCGAIFQSASGAHHKNMMVLRDGTAYGLIGSFNPKVRSTKSPRTHTVLRFEAPEGQGLFDFYAGEAARFEGDDSQEPLRLKVPVEGGGRLKFSFHPDDSNPALELLNNVDTCQGTLWVSYYMVLTDTIANPVFDRLDELVGQGCDVRVLLDEEDNGLAYYALLAKGIPVRYPTYPNGGGVLGHKIVSVISGDKTHLLQGSANLNLANHNFSNNLTVYVRVPSSSMTAIIDEELSRYWDE
jgi:hypothetical protein